MKSAEYLFASLWWEIALYVRNDKNQYAEKYHNFDAVIKEELNTAPDPTFIVKAEGTQHRADQSIQPFHSQDFILNELPHRNPPINLNI